MRLRRDPVGQSRARYAWVQRRVLLVHHALLLVIGLLPEQLERCVAEVKIAVRTRLGTDSALVALRALSAAYNCPCCPPLLWGSTATRRSAMRFAIGACQHKMGPDPPAAPP